MSKPIEFKGRIWVISDADGRLIDDIDTDMIYHNAHLAVTDIQKMGQYAFGNLQGWQDFPKKAQPGDIIICGKNFGAGSSRQHAVDCFKALGIAALIAESFGAIYKRNAINAGFPILTCPGLSEKLSEHPIPNDTTGLINFKTGRLIEAESEKLLLEADPFNAVQMDIYQAGNLFEYARSIS